MTRFIQYGRVVIEQYEHYQKGSYRNKCRILGPNGVITLSVPLRKGKHQQQPVREVAISYERPWYAMHWHTLQTAYGSAPFFAFYSGRVKSVLYARHASLFDLNLACLGVVLEILSLGKPVLSSTFGAPEQERDDLRNLIHPKRTLDTGSITLRPYIQVFSDRHSFALNLSVLDALFCLGPEARMYLDRCVQANT